MERRLKLQIILEEILGSGEVHFQPPPNKDLEYPCIIYSVDDVDTKFADNLSYLKKKRYAITVMDEDPDSTIPDKIGNLPLSSFNRHYTSDGLNHDVYVVYY